MADHPRKQAIDGEPYALRGITGSSALKAHVSIDPGSELIDEVAVTAANVSDRDAVDDLLVGLAAEENKPEVLGDSAYADGATRKALGDAGFEVVAKVPPVRNATGSSPRTTSASTFHHRA